jgi:Family of unknown function (DUF5681)
MRTLLSCLKSIFLLGGDTRVKREKPAKAAPGHGLVQVKLKGRPRGKAFAKGNDYGAATRFKPGMSGNPKGRSSEELRAAAAFSKALAERLVQVGSRKLFKAIGRTFTQKLTDVWIEKGLDGNWMAIVAMADRIEGRPSTSLTLDQGENPLTLLVDALNKRSEQIGRPEGFIERQLPERNDGDNQQD